MTREILYGPNQEDCDTHDHDEATWLKISGGLLVSLSSGPTWMTGEHVRGTGLLGPTICQVSNWSDPRVRNSRTYCIFGHIISLFLDSLCAWKVTPFCIYKKKNIPHKHDCFILPENLSLFHNHNYLLWLMYTSWY